MSDNTLDDDGIQHLADALRVNKDLKQLYLICCWITLSGTIHLAEALAGNKCLEKLSISCNRKLVSGDKLTIQKISEYLQNNHILTELHLYGDWSCACKHEIESAVNDIRKRHGLPLLCVRCTPLFTVRTEV